MAERKSLADDINFPTKSSKGQSSSGGNDKGKIIFACIALAVGVIGAAYALGWFDSLFSGGQIKQQMQESNSANNNNPAAQEQRKREQDRQALPPGNPKRTTSAGAG